MSKEVCARGGIVRASKHPDWIAPGPQPAGPGDHEDLWPAEGEDLCFLTGAWRQFQRLKGHRRSLDDVVTAWVALKTVEDMEIRRAADIGCGIGSVLMMTAWGLPEVQFVGVEAQDISQGLAKRSVRYNGAADRIEVRHGDLRDPEIFQEGERFDLVTGTPPYIPIGDGVMSEKEQCAPCRFEIRGGIEDYCSTAARILAPGGRFVVCHAAGQRERVLEAGRKAGLTTLSVKDVVPKFGRTPLLAVFVMCHESESQAELREDPPMLVRDEESNHGEEYLQMRRDMGMP